MGGATNCPETPRQKMIGMMYIVLTAMLALNVAADILNGFTMVEESLRVNIQGSESRNKTLYLKFEDLNGQNPAKVGEWLDKANLVKKESDALYNQIQDLKLQIVQTADGPEGTLDHIEARDNLDAAGRVCLDEGLGQGKVIKAAIEKYRDILLSMVPSDTAKVSLLKRTFDMGNVVGHDGVTVLPWEIATFEMMPVAAAITMLSKIQADVRNMEGDVVNHLKSMVDADDFRVNKIEAVVIPNSKYVIRGAKYTAQIVLAASDSTQKPEVFIGGNPETGTGGTLVPDGLLEQTATAIGDKKYSGYIRLTSPTGTKIYPFESDYNVGEPTAIVSADKMNVFYAGIDNEVSISVPGVPASNISASITGGSIRKEASGGWVVRPAKVGQNCVISVVAKIDGKDQRMGDKSFRVKALPPPVAYIPYMKDGNPDKYKGEGRLSKAALLNVTELLAELNDADIEAKYTVLSFKMNISGAMGAIVERSNGNKFSQQQMNQIKKMARGAKFFISGVIAKGPDGVERKLPPMEVTLN
ncbi:MAG: gliding motility protein GldM [Paludibacteraceae bacterium]|nr:gliding motility protein GldM [Paludibacteraceae bacterium]